jgi:hypothetical protein
MKKFVALFLCLLLASSAVLAAADYIGINKGGKYGAYSKTNAPELQYLKFYGVGTRAATTEIATGEAIMGVAVDGSGPYLYVYYEGPTNTYNYRTIRIGATNDAIALP